MTMLVTYTTYVSRPVVIDVHWSAHFLIDACHETKSDRLQCFLVYVGVRHASRPAPYCFLDNTPHGTRFVIDVHDKIEIGAYLTHSSGKVSLDRVNDFLINVCFTLSVCCKILITEHSPLA
jgi:hypothetical protein